MTTNQTSEDGFQLDSRLAGDCLFVSDLRHSRVLLLNDNRYPWLVLVPRRAEVQEIHHLSSEDQVSLWQEISSASQLLEQMFSPTKMNIGALGNIVNQLHVHIVARNENDPAWPGPVWGHSQAEKYSAEKAEKLVQEIASVFSSL